MFDEKRIVGIYLIVIVAGVVMALLSEMLLKSDLLVRVFAGIAMVPPIIVAVGGVRDVIKKRNVY